jgi:hypothetical protein
MPHPTSGVLFARCNEVAETSPVVLRLGMVMEELLRAGTAVAGR